MEKLDMVSYQKINDSFRKRMIYRVGVDCGFFVELNYMVNAMLFCLAHRIKFQLYSDDANFSTGAGWNEYFLPFCEEVHEAFHQKYNFHRLPSWRHILKVCLMQKSLGLAVWKMKKSLMTLVGRWKAFRTYGEWVLFAQDVSPETQPWYKIPDLGIDDDYTTAYAKVARMVWNLHPYILRQEKDYKTNAALPSLFSAVQIRGGDKITETRLIDGKTIINKLNLHDGDCLFILTDDYRQFVKAKEYFPKLRLFSLCQENEMGYYHKLFSQEDLQKKKDAISRLLISVDLLLSCKSFVGSITTGPSVFVLKLRLNDPLVQALDCPKEELLSALQLPINERAIISNKYV